MLHIRKRRSAALVLHGACSGRLFRGYTVGQTRANGRGNIRRAPARPSRRAPVSPAILALFAIDLLLSAGYYINYLAGRPFDLGAETNFTTWYASAKWLLVVASFGVLAWRGFQKRAHPRSASLRGSGARSVFRFYAGAHASRVCAVVGWVGFFGAAGGLVQVVAKDSGEMLAVTVICWSQLELLRGADARIAFEAPVGRAEPESIRPVGVP